MVEIDTKLCIQVGDNILIGRRMCGWIDMFLEGRASADDSECSGHLSTGTSDDKQEKPQPCF